MLLCSGCLSLPLHCASACDAPPPIDSPSLVPRAQLSPPGPFLILHGGPLRATGGTQEEKGSEDCHAQLPLRHLCYVCLSQGPGGGAGGAGPPNEQLCVLGSSHPKSLRALAAGGSGAASTSHADASRSPHVPAQGLEESRILQWVGPEGVPAAAVTNDHSQVA
jgi:hypothetical protein